MKNILVAYDGSESAKKAIAKTISIIKNNANVVVVYVVPANNSIEVNKDLQKGYELINKAVAKLKSKRISSIGLVRKGNVIDEILKIANEIQPEMIVVGQKGESRISYFAMGSVSNTIAKHAKCPVLIVK